MEKDNFLVKKTLTSAHAHESAQIDRVKQAARELGCDEDEAAFKAELAVIARQKPKGETKKTPEG